MHQESILQLFVLQDTNSVICNYQRHGYIVDYPVVIFENLVTNSRSVFVSNFSLKFRGGVCVQTPRTHPPSYGLEGGALSDTVCLSIRLSVSWRSCLRL